jgi:hypothetical protein
MKNLFNKSFFRFTIGFIGILIVSFALAALVSHIDTANSLPANASTGK